MTTKNSVRRLRKLMTGRSDGDYSRMTERPPGVATGAGPLARARPPPDVSRLTRRAARRTAAAGL
jgi:hypothetical protein